MSLDCKRSWQQQKPKRLEKRECSFYPIMETGISDRCRANHFNSHRMTYLSRGASLIDGQPDNHFIQQTANREYSNPVTLISETR
jgi:hypothetical protein